MLSPKASNLPSPSEALHDFQHHPHPLRLRRFAVAAERLKYCGALEQPGSSASGEDDVSWSEAETGCPQRGCGNRTSLWVNGSTRFLFIVCSPLCKQLDLANLQGFNQGSGCTEFQVRVVM